MRRTVESLAKEGRHGEACEILEQLLVLSPRNPLIWNDLGVEYEAAGNIEKALAAWKRGHAIDPTYPPTLYNLGKAKLEPFIAPYEGGTSGNNAQGILTEAIALLNASLDKDPDNADAHYYIALAYDLHRSESLAAAHMEVARRLREGLELPSNWTANP